MQFVHTMIRISDLEESLDFYCNKLGLVEVQRIENEHSRCTLIFLSAVADLILVESSQGPMLELTYHWDVQPYPEGRNFGFIAYTVNDIYETCKRLKESGVIINRPPRDGRMAYIRSPDNISIQLLQKGQALPKMEPWLSEPDIGQW